MEKLAIALLIASNLILQLGHENTLQSTGAASPPAPATITLAQTVTCQSILVPAYVYPTRTGSVWSRAIADSPWNSKTIRTLVVNPNSGPGVGFSRDYAAALQRVKAAGGKTQGYVWTNYGAVRLAEAEKQVDEYIRWYGPDALSGIFVDSASSDGSLIESYYQPLLSYITTKLPKATVTFNAGTYPNEKYAAMTTATPTSSFNIVVFEDNYANFSKDTSAAPAWTMKYPASKFVDIIYNASADQLAEALKLSVERNIGAVFITDGVMPNPYRGLPTYWKQLVASTQAGCSLGK